MNKRRILIVDDQSALRDLVHQSLQINDCEIYEAENGQQALDIVYKIKPDVIVLDIMMPGEFDGYQICEKLKQNKQTKSIYIILLSARAQKKDIEKGKEVGADYYMSKPFSPEQLNEVVKDSLSY